MTGTHPTSDCNHYKKNALNADKNNNRGVIDDGVIDNKVANDKAADNNHDLGKSNN